VLDPTDFYSRRSAADAEALVPESRYSGFLRAMSSGCTNLAALQDPRLPPPGRDHIPTEAR